MRIVFSVYQRCCLTILNSMCSYFLHFNANDSILHTKLNDDTKRSEAIFLLQKHRKRIVVCDSNHCSQS